MHLLWLSLTRSLTLCYFWNIVLHFRISLRFPLFDCLYFDCQQKIFSQVIPVILLPVSVECYALELGEKWNKPVIIGRQSISCFTFWSVKNCRNKNCEKLLHNLSVVMESLYVLKLHYVRGVGSTGNATGRSTLMNHAYCSWWEGA